MTTRASVLNKQAFVYTHYVISHLVNVVSSVNVHIKIQYRLGERLSALKCFHLLAMTQTS